MRDSVASLITHPHGTADTAALSAHGNRRHTPNSRRGGRSGRTDRSHRLAWALKRSLRTVNPRSESWLDEIETQVVMYPCQQDIEVEGLGQRNLQPHRQFPIPIHADERQGGIGHQGVVDILQDARHYRSATAFSGLAGIASTTSRFSIHACSNGDGAPFSTLMAVSSTSRSFWQIPSQDFTPKTRSAISIFACFSLPVAPGKCLVKVSLISSNAKSVRRFFSCQANSLPCGESMARVEPVSVIPSVVLFFRCQSTTGLNASSTSFVICASSVEGMKVNT